MTTELLVGVIVAGFALVAAMLAAWIKWSIRTAITGVVNGSLAEVSQGVARVEAWTKAHDRRHGHEQQQLIAALDRQGLAVPDGWGPASRFRTIEGDGIAREG